MSFKKTSDGKVFFQGANANIARDEDGEFTGFGGRPAGGETQLQILALLRSLNEKLKNTQAQSARLDSQLEIFRVLVEDLDSRTGMAEKKFTTLEKTLFDQAEETGAQQDRMEDVLSETRRELEKMRAAMLPSALSFAARLPAPQTAEASSPVAMAVRADPKSPPYSFAALYALVLSAFLITGIIMMWAMNGFHSPLTINPSQETTANAMRPVQQIPAQPQAKIDLTNQQQLNQMMDSDPDALANELNKLEPGTAPDEPPPAAQAAPAIIETASVDAHPAALPPASIQTTAGLLPPATTSEAPIVASSYDVHGMITPDPALPAALKPVEEKALSGSLEDQHNLAALYTSTKGSVKQDYKRAVFWFRQAAERGMANAQYNLGVMYQQGLGVQINAAEAVRWYQAAAAQHHAEAEYNLGIAYIQGTGVGYDPARAVENFENAAGQGVIEASYNLGLIYENALLGRADPSKALAWYKKAADQGSPEAKAALTQLARTLNIDMQDIDRVVSESGKT